MNTKLKLHVVSFTGNSGLTDYSVSLCNELNKLCDVTFVTAESYDANKYRVDFPAVKIFRRTRHYWLDIFKFVFFIVNSRPDVVLFESWIKYPLIEIPLVLIFKLCGIRMALTIHDLLPHYPKPWSRLVLSWYYNCFDRLIVHSQRSVDGLVDMDVEKKPLLVPHGVYDIFNIDKLSREEVLPNFPAIAKEDFVVLFFGHIETRKGILEFLAASELLTMHQSIKFLVAGGNSLIGDAAEQFERFRSAKNVIIHDQMVPMEQVQNYFTVADVIAVPYLEGTTSGVVKLAMAFGKPIIASDVGDFSETLDDWAGTLIALDDIPKGLAAAILKMRDEYTGLMKDMDALKHKYQWDQIAGRHIEHLN